MQLFFIGSEQSVIDAVLPRGQSNTDFFSAQFIPSNAITKWNFFIPPKHNFTVKFLDYTSPECQSKAVKVIYSQANKDPVEKPMAHNQTFNLDGNFSMILANCDAVRQAISGLSLNFTVLVFRGGYPGKKMLCLWRMLIVLIFFPCLNWCQLFCHFQLSHSLLLSK